MGHSPQCVEDAGPQGRRVVGPRPERRATVPLNFGAVTSLCGARAGDRAGELAGVRGARERAGFWGGGKMGGICECYQIW
jgi:hypothetical protein